MIRRAWPAMGSVASLAVPTGAAVHGLAFDRAARRVQAWFEEVEQALSPYRVDSDLSRWRAGALELEDSPQLAEMVRACAPLEEVTQGGFHPYDRQGRFDPTGYAKGWAIERGIDLLEQAGIAAANLGIGGDQQAVGRAEDRPWRVAITDPAARARVVAIVTAPADGSRFAVATSGDAERGDHIWLASRPASGPVRGPAADLACVTVVGPLLGLADAFATAVWAHARIRPLDEAWAWLAGTGYEAVALDRSGRLRVTPGMSEHLVRAAA